MKRKVLILGSQGMLGHDLVQAFSGYDLTAWDRGDLDITNEEQVIKKILELNPEIVINAAAYTDVDGAEEDEKTAMQVNGEGPGFLAKACHQIGAILVHYSTEYVFEGTNKDGYAEKDKTKPVNVYGQSKLAGEILVQSHHNRYYIIRSSWLYGKAPQRGKPRGLNFIETMLKLSSESRTINVVEDQFGKPTYSKDLAIKTKEIIEQEEHFGIYHVTNEGECSWYEFALEIFKIKGIDVKVNPIKSEDYPLPTPRPQYAILKNTKIEKLRPWQEALKEYLSH